MKNIAVAFGMPCIDIRTKEDLRLHFPAALQRKGPVIIDCQCLAEQEILPAQALKNGKQAGLHDMIPFLSQNELEQEMIVRFD
jgi:thiamine pyrophosphate-dependent acetolactate synthase large subunit-like protein